MNGQETARKRLASCRGVVRNRGVETGPSRLDPLAEREVRHRRRAEALRIETRARLRAALREVLRGVPVLVFGSLTRPGGFRFNSDVDLALWEEPPGVSRFGLAAQLEEAVGRPVDLLLLGESRFREKLLREGEIWTDSD